MKLPSKILAIAAVASGLATAAPAAVETYTIDPVHSAVGFSIRHFVSKVPGRFTQFSGTITVDRDNLENSSVEATIDVGSPQHIQ
jgi:polyisoprenoid-binding protein YceI